MKRLLFGSVASAIIFGSMITPAFAVSEHASPKACFGQGRANYALNGSESVGYWASLRKGDNAAMNAAYRDACQP